MRGNDAGIGGEPVNNIKATEVNTDPSCSRTTDPDMTLGSSSDLDVTMIESFSYLSLQDIFPTDKGEEQLRFHQGCCQDDTVKSSQEVSFLHASP
ncbi:hypothetical protein STEG23_027470 [Scotinomys teguina]